MKSVIDTGGPKLTITDEHPDYPDTVVLLDPGGKPLHYEQVLRLSPDHSMRVGDLVNRLPYDDEVAPDIRTLVMVYIEAEMQSAIERPGSLEMVKSAIARFANWDGDDEGVCHAVQLWASQLMADYHAAEASGDKEAMVESSRALHELGDTLTEKDEDDDSCLLTFDADALVGPDGPDAFARMLADLAHRLMTFADADESEDEGSDGDEGGDDAEGEED